MISKIKYLNLKLSILVHALKNSKIQGKFLHYLFIFLVVSEVNDEVGEYSV